MSEQENRDTLERYRQEFFERKDNARTVYENYPSIPNLIEYSYRLNGDLAVIEMILDYDGNRMNVCEIVDFEDGKIKRARGYFGEPFEAAEWRAQWVERM